MRSLLLLLALLAATAAAQPYECRGQGPVSESRPQTIGLEGTFFQGEIALAAVTDLRDCRQFRLTLTMSNRGKKAACWAMHLALLDGKGRLVGACSFNQSGPIQTGQKVSWETDMGMNRVDLASVRSFRLVFYEDTVPLGKR